MKPNLQFPETQRLEELPRECGEPVTRQVSARRTNTGELQGRSGTGDAPGSTPGHVAEPGPVAALLLCSALLPIYRPAVEATDQVRRELRRLLKGKVLQIKKKKKLN